MRIFEAIMMFSAYLIFDFGMMKDLTIHGVVDKDFYLKNATSQDDFFWRLLYWIIPFSWVIVLLWLAGKKLAGAVRFFRDLPPKD